MVCSNTIFLFCQLWNSLVSNGSGCTVLWLNEWISHMGMMLLLIHSATWIILSINFSCFSHAVCMQQQLKDGNVILYCFPFPSALSCWVSIQDTYINASIVWLFKGPVGVQCPLHSNMLESNVTYTLHYMDHDSCNYLFKHCCTMITLYCNPLHLSDGCTGFSAKSDCTFTWEFYKLLNTV